jgi:hypothetical protein
VVGAIALDRTHSWLTRRWSLSVAGRVGLFAAMLVVPAFAVSAGLGWRGGALFQGDPVTGWPAPIPMAALDAVPCADGFVVPVGARDEFQPLVAYVRSRTEPGEPILAYPTSPLLYVVTERPNPTRFDHLYPGAATPAEVEEIIAILTETPVRLVAVSDIWESIWGPPGLNAPLEDFLASHYVETARFGHYHVLELAS